MFALMKCSFTPYQHLGQATLLLLCVASPLHPHRLFTAVCPIHFKPDSLSPRPTEGG